MYQTSMKTHYMPVPAARSRLVLLHTRLRRPAPPLGLAKLSKLKQNEPIPIDPPSLPRGSAGGLYRALRICEHRIIGEQRDDTEAEQGGAKPSPGIAGGGAAYEPQQF